MAFPMSAVLVLGDIVLHKPKANTEEMILETLGALGEFGRLRF